MILITRDINNANKLAYQLKEKGFSYLIYPLFKVLYLKANIFNKIITNIFKPQSVIITSSNALEYFYSLNFPKNIKIFAVAQNTANNLKGVGYNNIIIANNASKVLAKIISSNPNKRQKILYLSGEIISHDICQSLTESGLKAKRIIAYKISEQQCLSSEIITKIRNNNINHITIYSNNTANILKRLLGKYTLLKYCRTINLLCFSQDIIEYCQEIGFSKCSNIEEYVKKDQ